MSAADYAATPFFFATPPFSPLRFFSFHSSFSYFIYIFEVSFFVLPFAAFSPALLMRQLSLDEDFVFSNVPPAPAASPDATPPRLSCCGAMRPFASILPDIKIRFATNPGFR